MARRHGARHLRLSRCRRCDSAAQAGTRQKALVARARWRTLESGRERKPGPPASPRRRRRVAYGGAGRVLESGLLRLVHCETNWLRFRGAPSKRKLRAASAQPVRKVGRRRELRRGRDSSIGSANPGRVAEHALAVLNALSGWMACPPRGVWLYEFSATMNGLTPPNSSIIRGPRVTSPSSSTCPCM